MATLLTVLIPQRYISKVHRHRCRHYTEIVINWTSLGSTNQKIDILKITRKVLSCVGVALSRKHYYGSKFHAFFVVEISKICYQIPCISARWSTSFKVYHILHTGSWLGVNILVNVAVHPVILLCSRSQILKNIVDRQKNDAMAIRNTTSVRKILNFQY